MDVILVSKILTGIKDVTLDSAHNGETEIGTETLNFRNRN